MPDFIPLPPDAVAYFIGQAQTWVRGERDRFRPLARPLPESARTLLGAFFPASVFESARWHAVSAIENPQFLADAAALGINLDFSAMEGITFDDTFLVTQAALAGDALDPLVFHELVHAVQYQVLGADEFVSQYVRGYLASGEYYTIPLELVAYALQSRWMVNPEDVFSVEDVVRRTVGLRRV